MPPDRSNLEQRSWNNALGAKHLEQSTWSKAMADVTYYVALPFMQDDTGSPVAGAAEECQSSSGALRRAEVLSKAAGSIGAVAFSRTGDPMIGEFGDAQLLKKFGNVPDDLSGL
jgi:hypothetical protein